MTTRRRTRRSAVTVVVVCLCALLCGAPPRTARAAQYEFTLQGQVTQAAWPNVAVGDLFTMKYVADSSDQDPLTSLGRYAASNAVVTLPNTTITAFGGPRVNVFPVTPIPEQRVQYASLSPNYHFTVDFWVPPGTLASDALPLTLPVAPPTETEWEVYDFGPLVRGNITSYSSALVPEPGATFLLLMAAAAALSRQRVMYPPAR